jgi:uncharacterized protein (DUF488 family)
VALWTVGHGKRSAEALVTLLGDHDIALLIDVRRYPGSRRNPQFGRDALAAALAEHSVRYEWWGAALGGRREPIPDGSRHPAWRDDAFRGYADHMDRPEFRAAFSHLLSVAAQQATAVMCSETLWWRCHRRLLADCAELRGTPVVHLLAPGRAEGHRLHPAVRPGDDGWPVYDLGVQTELSAGG